MSYEYDDGDLYDPYDDSEDQYYIGQDNEYLSLADLWKYCIQQSLQHAFDTTAFIILSSCVLRGIASIGRIPRTFVHILSAIFGLYCMTAVFDWHGFYAFTYGVICVCILYLTDLILRKWRTIFVLIGALTMIIGGGEYSLQPPQWNHIRGSVMIMTMKILSLSLDMDNDLVVRMPSLCSVFGYMFHCGSVIFGPWVSFYDYHRSIEEQIDLYDPIWLLSLTRSCLLSGMCLILSTCGVNWVLERFDNYGIWLLAFKDAMMYRFSHYFVCFHGEASAVASGIGRLGDVSEWNLEIVNIKRIELPRSLVEVVVFWNRPMHVWLKNYVFKPTIRWGRFVAIFATFVASALLHGLNFQISAVLLSLGFYTYVEYNLRAKMASAFDACIEARECHEGTCKHKYKREHFSVFAFNSLFGLIALFHLTYLGTMFDSSQDAESGYSMSHTLQKWSELSFASHWLFLAMFVLNLIV